MKILQFLRFSLILTMTYSLSHGVQADTALSNVCDFSKQVNLRPTDRYGIFGDDAFDTVVCGYLVTRMQQLWDEPIHVAYLRILKFGQAGFQQAIATGITQGNSVNVLRQGQYEFNLGCFENGRVKGQAHTPEKPYLTDAVQEQLVKSSETRPIKLILSFEKHPGRSCECCNLADSIRLY